MPNSMNKAVWLTSGALGGMAASFAAQTYMRYQRETHASLERLRAGSQLVEISGTSIEYAIAGAGLPVLISHGAAGGYDQGLAMAQPLGDDFRCVAPSRFGYLRTPLPVDAGAAAQADAYAALLDAIGIQRAALIGVSAGGPSAVQFALRYLDRCAALILAAAVNQAFPLGRLGIVLSQVMLRTDFLFWLMMTAIPHVMIGYAGASTMLTRLAPADRRWLLGLMQTMLPISCRRAGILNDLVENARFDRGLLSRISVPTLIIHALDDPLVPFADSEYAARAIAGAQLIVLEDGGHFGLAGDRAKFDLMVAFIRQHARSSV